MSKETNISWADSTWSPWWGCSKIASGCLNCYAETFSKRLGKRIWGSEPRHMLSQNHWDQPVLWNREARLSKVRRSVFCGSMCDVFEDLPELIGTRLRLFNLIEDTPSLDWLLLTKRPVEALQLLPDSWIDRSPTHTFMGFSASTQADLHKALDPWLEFWKGRRKPLVPEIKGTYFLSLEPLIGPISLDHLNPIWCECVIVGGESGPRHRPMDPVWAEDIRQWCQANRVPFFMKQLSQLRPGTALEDLPENLRVREHPWPVGGKSAGWPNFRE